MSQWNCINNVAKVGGGSRSFVSVSQLQDIIFLSLRIWELFQHQKNVLDEIYLVGKWHRRWNIPLVKCLVIEISLGKMSGTNVHYRINARFCENLILLVWICLFFEYECLRACIIRPCSLVSLINPFFSLPWSNLVSSGAIPC